MEGDIVRHFPMSHSFPELFVLLLAGFEQSPEAISFPLYLAAHEARQSLRRDDFQPLRRSVSGKEECSASFLYIAHQWPLLRLPAPAGSEVEKSTKVEQREAGWHLY